METNSYYLWFLIGSLFIIFAIGVFIINKKMKQSLIFSKSLYVISGIITAALLTPSLAYLFTLNVSSFEGGRGFALLYSMPIIFMALLFTWFILHLIFAKKKKFYHTTRKIFSIISLLLVLVYFGLYIKDKREIKNLKRNSYRCKQKIKETYTGIVVDTSRGNVKIRKIDTTYKEFKYIFNDVKLLKQYFYIGQKITKKANEEKFEAVLKNDKTKHFTIPCYQ